ncbi:MAG: magnesium transporter [Candidatus Obscuribacterales bacterium]|nr:magnesium transporter [Steroidobacteraceae bacterium]
MSAKTPKKLDQLATLRAALERRGSVRRAQRMVNSMHPAEIASLLESLPPAKREIVWGFIDPELEGDVLVELNEQVRGDLMSGMDAEELIAATENMEVDDLADVIGDLPEAVNQQVLRSLDSQDRERLNAVLGYEQDSAGGLMNTDTVSVRPDVTLEVVLRYLRMRGELPDRTDRLFVVNRHDHYLGALDVTRLLTDDPDHTVAEVMDSSVAGISADTAANEVTKLFENRDLVSAAVVAGDGKLLGRITVDDVVDVIREQADHSVKSLANLQDEEDLFSAVIPSTRRRGVWLGINLLTAFLASGVVAIFESTIDRVVALAVLMPIVASMGGIAGTQTVTLIVRGLALGQVNWSNTRWLLLKELTVAALNGIVWAAVVGAYTMSIYGEWKLAGIIFAALIMNLLAAAIVGVTVPLMLKKLRVDPALASGVILTTFTDCIGFAALLGLGAIFLV